MDQKSSIRPFGDYERYSLAEDNTNYPQLVTYIATYPSAGQLPSLDSLCTRAQELVEEFPLLKGRVVDGRTTSPKWDVWCGDELDRGMNRAVYDKSLLDLPSPDLEGVISGELGDYQPLRLASSGFAWRIVRFLPRHESGPAFVALTINHVISDGKSSLALFNAVLNPSTGKTDSSSRSFPPAMESTMDFRPGYFYLLKTIWKELLIPKLPTILANTLKQTPCWPGLAPSRDYIRPSYKHISLDAPQVSRLKALGRQNQVKSLHPILAMAANLTLWQTFAAAEIACDSPISVRDSALGHPTISGNYVANVESRISCTEDGNEQFWERARDFSAWLSSDTGRRQAKFAMGMLAYVPDGENDVPPDSPSPTGWETFLLDKMTRAPSSSLEVSNLGYTELPPQASSIVFAQTPSPFIAPVLINALGHPGGLELVVCWREGAFVYEGTDMTDFTRTYQAVLVYLADIDRDRATITFSDLREAVVALTER